MSSETVHLSIDLHAGNIYFCFVFNVPAASVLFIAQFAWSGKIVNTL